MATTELYANAARLRDAMDVLKSLCTALQDPNTSRTKILKKTRMIKNNIIPLVSTTADTIDDTAKTLAPIASLKYVHNRKERKRRNDVIDQSNKNNTPGEQMIAHHVAEKKKGTKKEESPPKKRKSTRTAAIVSPNKVEEEETYPLPKPASGEMFDKLEVVKIVSNTIYNTKERGNCIRAIVDHQKQYHPTFNKKTINRLMTKHGKGEEISGEFTKRGRIPLCNDAEVTAIAQELEKDSGKTINKDDVKEILTKKKNEKIEASGLVPIIENNVSEGTVRNYTALLADEPNLSLSESSRSKSTSRDTAERSLRGAVGTAAVIASTHFIPLEEEDPDIQAELNTLPESTRMFTDMVSAAWGCPVYPIDPAYIYSTDDTTEYIFEGIKKGNDEFVLAPKASIRKRGTNALYNTNDDNAMNGMRVKLTFTFSGLGNVMPIVVTVSGLTEKEMPNGLDFIDAKVPGLSGGNRDGYLLFMRNTKGAHVERAKWYQKTVLFPQIAKDRKKYGKFDESTGCAIPDKLTAISASDSDLSQIEAVADTVDDYAEHKVIAVKQHAARTAVEQPADLAKVFMLIKRLLPTFTCVDDDHRDKQMIVDAFKKHGKLKMLRLATNKKKSLIDFLCRLPELIERTCASSNIQHGFIEAGIIDKVKKRYPVFTKIIATCRRNPTIPEFRNILDNFGYFLEAACEYGYVPEELYDLYNVVQDTEAGGKVVLRNAGISQEHMQRTKVLTHESQVQLRKERILASQKSERAKKERENAKHQDKIDANQEVCDLLYDMLDKKGLLTDEEKEDLKEEYLERCTLEMFDDILGDMQVHFILAHQDMEKPVFVTKSSLPNKGTLEEAQDEKAYTKTRIAFDCRTVPNCLLGRHPHDLSEDVMIEEQEQSPAWRVLSLSLADEEEVLPSALLSNEQWVKYVVDLFDLDKLEVGLEVDEEVKAKADLLVKMLRERFHEHLKQRIKDKARRTHWSMKLAYKNLAVDAVLMVLSNHSAQCLECLGDSDSLLNTGINCFLPGERFPDRQGAYLYRDNNRGKIIRSGKKTRGGIVGRHKEHLKAAKAKKATSNFYNLYPSELSPRKTNRNKKGYFEGLSLLIAAAFDHTSDNAMNLEKDWNEGGLLILSEDDKRSIKESMNSSNLTPIQKFHDIVAYQVELGYDLAIEPSLNVSRSPGFESVLGIFGGQE